MGDTNASPVAPKLFNSATGVGLFGVIDTGSEVKNIGMLSVDIAGKQQVGGVVGYITGGTITNCYSTGDVVGTVADVGGLVGNNAGTITKSYSKAYVRGNADFEGGLIGLNSGTISGCYAEILVGFYDFTLHVKHDNNARTV